MQRLMRLAFLILFLAAGAPLVLAAEANPPAPPDGSAPSVGPPPATPADQADLKELMVAGPLGEVAQGDPKAPVTLIEYASMTCPHCKRFHDTTYKALKEKYIDTGKVLFILREFPLDPLAMAAIMLARCAPKEKYFPIVDVLFDLQDNWAFVDNPGPALFNVLQPMGFTEDSFNACISNEEVLAGVSAVRQRADEKFNIQATPTFFFNGLRKSGELTIDEVDRILEPLLKS
jgi:protein-disulfide isomerase